MKAAFYTLGCKVNQYESTAMGHSLQTHGFEIVSPDSDADVYIINSCSVTAESDRKTRQAVRRFKKNHPDSIIVLTGCMSQAVPKTGIDLIEADIVMGNKTNINLYENIIKFQSEGRVIDVQEHKTGDKFICENISDFYEKTRAEIKIEDGCNRFCSYCIIPYARGRVRSKPLDVIKEECISLAEKGYKEIVLVGINLSAYGTDVGSSLVEAVSTVASIDNIKRVRLGSLEPDHITDEVIEGLSKIPEFCPQFHISLQSGCDKTLKKMNRHYNAEEYYTLCQKLRFSFSDTTLTTDIMVGFPDETDDDFNESLEFAKKVGFEKVHVFPYSRRPGTPADKMPNQVSPEKKEERAKLMSETCESIRMDYLKKQIGRTLKVLPEEYHNGFSKGYTANYTPIIINGECTANELIDVLITGVENDCCIGRAL